MDQLSPENLSELIDYQSARSISIFIPTVHAQPEERDANRIHLKNAVKHARELLEAHGWEEDGLLDSAENLLNTPDFIDSQVSGLALFSAPDFNAVYRLPVSFEPRAYVTTRFHVKPLIPYLNRQTMFYILALSQNELRLFEATSDRVTQKPLVNVPTSLAEALKYDDPERRLRGRSATPNSIAYHAHDPSEEEDSNLTRFFQQVNDGIRDSLDDPNAPVVLAGTENLFPFFHQTTDLPNVLNGGISGNPEQKSGEELQRAAWKLIAPRLAAEQQAAAEKVNGAIHTENATTDLSEIVRAANYGQIDMLLLPSDMERWGEFDGDTGTVTLHDEMQTNSAELLDMAAAQTLKHGGKVYLSDELSDGPALAAYLRFSIPEPA